MGIKDQKRFAELDALIKAGYGNTPQDKIPIEVLDAVEAGEDIPHKGPDERDDRWAREVGEPLRPPAERPPLPPGKRVTTQAQRDRINERARARWFYKYGPRDRPEKKEGTNECQDACSAE
jgi:hypothetical protein